jgi:hypothetical protein
MQGNQQGISRILLLAGILLIGLIIAAGIFFALKSNEKLSPTNQSTSPYLTISEWGVRFPLSAGNRDTYYNLVKYQGGIGEGVKIYSKDFNAMKNANGLQCWDEEYPLLVINRVAAQRGQQMNSPDLPQYDPTSGPYKTYNFQINFAFGPSKPGLSLPPCVNLSTGTQQAFKADQTALKAYQAKVKALTDGYAKLEAVPSKPTTKK